MYRTLAHELEFDKVQQMVAAQAQTCLGRSRLTELSGLPSSADALHSAQLTRAVGQLIDDDGRLSLAGLDDASEWLGPEAPVPTETGDLLTLLTLARRIDTARKRLAGSATKLVDLANTLPDTRDLIRRVCAPRLGRDGTIPDHASPELARTRRQIARTRQDLLQQLEGIRRGFPGVTTDAPPTVRRDRYCLPVRANSRAELPGLLLDMSGSGATAFVEPLQVVNLNNDLADTAARERAEIRRIVAEIAATFLEIRDELAAAAETLVLLDTIQAKVIFGRLVDGRVVTPADGEDFILRQARHPLLDERLLPLRVDLFGTAEQRDPSLRVVPLDFRPPEGVRTLVVSGPNAGGKTLVLKTLGLMALMCYHGIPLPVDEGSAIPFFNHIWCHIGDEQDVAADLSSFSGAMAATTRLLKDAGQETLVLYDELGAGTDPLEGAALGCALLEELTARSCLSVVTTHLAAVALAAGEADRMDNAAMEYDEAASRATYTLTIGRPGRSRALEIAARSGMSKSILDRAHELLGGQHLELDRWLRRLEEVEIELLRQRDDLALQLRELRDRELEAARELEQLQIERQRLPKEIADERDRLRRRAQRRLDDAMARLDEATARQERLGKRQRQRLRDAALALDERTAETADVTAADLQPGTRVRLLSLGRYGTLDGVRGNRAVVSVAGKRLWVAASEVVPDETQDTPQPRATIRVMTDDMAGFELKLIGMNSEEAREELERFLDHAFTSGRSMVRVVHGHGTGTLRRTVAEICRTHPAVHSFRHPPQNMGGTGVTEVTLDQGE